MLRIFLVFLLFLALPAQAQLPKAFTSAPVVGPPAPKDALRRETPRGMIQGFLKSVGAENYDQAAQFLDIAPDQGKQRGAELSRGLQKLLDQGGWVRSASHLSEKPEGDLDDGLPPEIERVGTIRAGKQTFDLTAQRFKDPEVGFIWRLSKDTVANIPRLRAEMSVGPLDRVLPEPLISNKVYGVPVGHWIAAVVLALGALGLACLLTIGLVAAIRVIWPKTQKGYAGSVLDAFVWPIRLYIAAGIFVIAARVSGISIVARQNFGLFAGAVTWLAIAWFLWRAIDLASESLQGRMNDKKRRGGLSAVIFFRRTARFFLAAIAVAMALDGFGWDVTAGMTALGLGGLALALGAQKTAENFIASLTLVIEQPVRIGDFCKIGGTEGTVTDIGMRSTRLFTRERTMVTVPNGLFVTQMVENHAMRDRHWLHPTLELRSATGPDQIRAVLTGVRDMLLADDRIVNDTVRVRFTGFESGYPKVEISAYVRSESRDAFQVTREELLLRIMDVLDAAGTGLAVKS